MTILAVDFSSDQRSAALLRREKGGPPRRLARVEETAARSTRALHLVERALREGGVAREAIDAIAVGLGPGSYTGIRVAISLAQGWQLARGVKLQGVNSAAAIALGAAESGLTGSFSVVIDAHRGEFYVAEYTVEGAGLRTLGALRLLTAEALEGRARSGERLVGPGADRRFEGGRHASPDAEMVGRLAAGQKGYSEGETLEPIYLRPAQFVKAPPPRWGSGETGDS